jgi:protein gp37
MGRISKIGWTNATFNGWRGCTKVSDGCKFCYADRDSKRNPGVLGVWGPEGTRVAASEAMWRGPSAWDKAAAAEGVRLRVFSASLSDVFEEWPGPVVDAKGREWTIGAGPGLRPLTLDDLRRRLFDLIRLTPNLDWLLLTKRPENVVPMLKRAIGRCADMAEPLDRWLADWVIGEPPANAWLGTSVEDQATADARLPVLLGIPAAIRWASLEPLLGPVDLLPWIAHGSLGWVVVGGESGAFEKVRPFHTGWADELIGQCREAGVPCFVKQMGSHCRSWRDPQEWAPGVRNHVGASHSEPYVVQLDAPAGSDPAEWPADLRVREFPASAARPRAEASP